MIDRFFRPFLGGIFFNRELSVTSRLFTFVMRMLATGTNCLPAKGIGEVSRQLAAELPSSTICLNTRATGITQRSSSVAAAVATGSGGSIQCKRGIVVAAEGPEARQLLTRAGMQPDKAGIAAKDSVGTCCAYFETDAQHAPPHGNVLYLDGEQRGVVNNACVPSAVASSYAPAGKALISCSTIGTYPDMSEEDLVKVQCQHTSHTSDSLDSAPRVLLRRVCHKPCISTLACRTALQAHLHDMPSCA